MNEISFEVHKPLNPALVPNPFFVATPQHYRFLYEMLKDHILGHHSLLIGNQGFNLFKSI